MDIDNCSEENQNVRSGGRLHIDSLTSLHYQVPNVAGWDLEPPYELPDTAGPMGTRRLFFILPDQISARLEIESKYTDGSTFPRYNRHERLLFYVGSTGQP